MSKSISSEQSRLNVEESKRSVSDAGIDCISLGTAVPPCEVSDMDQDFLNHLLLAQKALGKKFRINCAYRSLAYEKSKGRNGLSSHVKGLAVDIATPNHADRLFIVAALIMMGFRRIGIARTFIHVDDDADKNPSLWLYDLNNLSKTF